LNRHVDLPSHQIFCSYSNTYLYALHGIVNICNLYELLNLRALITIHHISYNSGCTMTGQAAKMFIWTFWNMFWPVWHINKGNHQNRKLERVLTVNMLLPIDTSLIVAINFLTSVTFKSMLWPYESCCQYFMGNE